MNRTTPGLSRRGFLQITGATGLAAAVTACGAGGSSSGGSSGSLTVLCESGGHAELTKIAAAFKQRTGHGVTFVELPYDGLYNRLNSELSTGSVSFDLAAVDAIWLPTFAGALQPLDDLFTAEVKADLFDSLVDGAQIKGKYVGMPAWTNAEVLFYRKDLFENPGEKAAFQKKYGYELAPPKTWQQFQDAASFFTRGTRLYGTDVKGAVETEWLAHVLQAGSPGVVLDDSGKVIIDNAQHLAALKFYSGLNNRLKVSPPGAAQMDWAGAQNLFNQGKTAMMRFWAHAYPLIPKDSPVHGKVGVAPMFAGSAGIGGVPGPFYLSVPNAGKHDDLAKRFIKFAYENNRLAIQSSLGLAARKSAYSSYASKPGYEHFKALLTTLDGPATKSRPASPKWQQIVDTVLVPMLQKSLTPGADYAALLVEARKEVEKLVQ
ncbi:sugar ABC transporter substrate-binding protein [Streptomyces sp. NPDC004546]|uniref:ABC transporter substrate-binding protein n=1 Tax=unclassified Streptomyces TaxID=2593676 RepID=UPI0033A7E677